MSPRVDVPVAAREYEKGGGPVCDGLEMTILTIFFCTPAADPSQR
jgi:hypothetical protein